MKCTSNRAVRLAATAVIAVSCLLGGCSSEIRQEYSLVSRAKQYDLIGQDSSELMAKDLCPYVKDSSGASDNTSVLAAGAFNESTGKTMYSQKLLEKIYPASTTKILTALVAIENGDLNQMCTVSANAVKLPAGSSNAGLKEGDRLSLNDLLKGMLLESGNDAARAVAEAVSGSEEKFADLMNKTAQSMGATHSHFVNSDGLPDDDHYTCAYDMYIIFHNAIQHKEFVDMIKARKLDAVVTAKDGSTKVVTYHPTNMYLTGRMKAPDGITVIGGKTGTTDKAGYCLVLLSQNKNSGQQIVTVVFKANSRYDLYQMTNKLLTSFASA